MSHRIRTGPGIRGALVTLAAFALSIATVQAKPPQKSVKTTGELNPTNTAVTDTDFDVLSMEPTTADQLDSGLAQMDATGAGVVVAVLDGGFNTHHPDIAPNISPLGYDFVDDDRNPNSVGNGIDDDGDGLIDEGLGHGTFVAGMVLSAAPGATIIPLRIADDEGHMTGRNIVSAMMYAVESGADVLNLSLEPGSLNSSLARKALRFAEQNNVVLVVSAGNSGVADLTFFANSPQSITVGAVDDQDVVAPFSNQPTDEGAYGIFAPGVDLFGPTGFPTNDGYGYWSGTSFSAGIVSGGVALARQLHPGMSPEAIRALIVTCVDPVYTAEGTFVPYAGRINLSKVVNW